ncbi:MAG TPA: hypothetical protein VGQ81_06390, partial [Acidobacteriota bacterium]|nr:hypothetical protein [Acidobacteriota bacterium]
MTCEKINLIVGGGPAWPPGSERPYWKTGDHTGSPVQMKSIFSQLLGDGSCQSESAVQTFLWRTLLLWRDPSLTLRALTFSPPLLNDP